MFLNQTAGWRRLEIAPASDNPKEFVSGTITANWCVYLVLVLIEENVANMA